MTTQYEYKSIKVPMTTRGKRQAKKRDKLLNYHAQFGWRLDHYERRGFSFGFADVAILRRPVQPKRKLGQPKEGENLEARWWEREHPTLSESWATFKVDWRKLMDRRR